MTIADKILAFNQNLIIGEKLPEDISILFPFNDKNVIKATNTFYQKYYEDNNERIILLGINPGRFGAGITGIPFTDPIRLENECGIKNTFDKKPELSSDFVYRVINAFGGVKDFYNRFLISSLCPLGFVKNGKNLNYYDEKELEEKVNPFIVTTLKQQIEFGINTNVCFCLGEGKNYKYFAKLNDEHRLFKKIIPLAHPRYIMQYKRRMLGDYISGYNEKLKIN